MSPWVIISLSGLLSLHRFLSVPMPPWVITCFCQSLRSPWVHWSLSIPTGFCQSSWLYTGFCQFLRSSRVYTDICWSPRSLLGSTLVFISPPGLPGSLQVSQGLGLHCLLSVNIIILLWGCNELSTAEGTLRGTVHHSKD